MGGMHPVVALYSTFLNRAFDQLLMDVALHRLAVTLVLDRAGVTGEDGPSHNGMWDLSLLGDRPGPAGGRAARRRHAARGAGRGVAGRRRARRRCASRRARCRLGAGGAPDRLTRVDVSGAVSADGHRRGRHPGRTAGGRTATCCWWRSGRSAELARRGGAAAGRAGHRGHRRRPALGAAGARRSWSALAAGHRLVVTVEDGGRHGGFGAALADALRRRVRVPVRDLALPQEFLEHGTRADLLAALGLTAQDVARGITEEIARAAPDPGRVRAPAGWPATGPGAPTAELRDQAEERRAMRVLVVEDERRLADAIARGLRREGMAVDVAYDGDSRAPEGDLHPLRRGGAGPRPARRCTATTCCAEIVAAGDTTRVLMLTATAGSPTRSTGCPCGADDYLAKPFAFPELVARVRALGRRATPAAPPVLRGRRPGARPGPAHRAPGPAGRSS